RRRRPDKISLGQPGPGVGEGSIMRLIEICGDLALEFTVKLNAALTVEAQICSVLGSLFLRGNAGDSATFPTFPRCGWRTWAMGRALSVPASRNRRPHPFFHYRDFRGAGDISSRGEQGAQILVCPLQDGIEANVRHPERRDAVKAIGA